ncbi:MAG: cobalt-precorrin-5B (C(1))-methyltransferase [Dehalococcoidia bacterium]|jgi:cobalt-precorrin-5B (C1)-methyltransferase|nr:cobalt-precorrin-5B (C(1))-methyltransferase [Dehalococcoidia bacterium]MDP7084010.1 cobalt-precorrin-5B (C(1))-methyltransferase [Dehalococcoidia bacterium]MDP7511743.1 cobalt-precorrin-5B (C(1))-methyltransferase [Dehalococcoidia bacterium]HJN85683.1 cobalt-precorrin-5B (C(1))-methyltransferase [Dehalococcoidia bacterium]
MNDGQAANGRQESEYSLPTVRGRGLRTGYTTGACAAAAAKAATLALLTGNPVGEVSIHLPIGRDVTMRVHRCEWAGNGKAVLCSTIKDGGDDPDATHGAEICATVSLDPEATGEVRIVGGLGVGTVTRPGTGIAIGEPAVTRVPRRMIIESVREAAGSQGLGAEAGFIVQVSVPGGEEIAKKTTNARLGIMGGISILGSTGVVQPYSTAAWRASVHMAIDVASANGLPHLVLSTGTQSEAFTKQCLDLPEMAYIEAGIFSGPALKRCVTRKVARATHAGMVGKLSKMAMGYFVTHVAGNKVDCTFLASLAAECGASPQVQEEMRLASSARHFQEIAQAHGLLAVFPLMCRLVCDESLKLLGADSAALIVDALCFDFDGSLLGWASTSPGGIPLVASSGAAPDG